MVAARARDGDAQTQRWPRADGDAQAQRWPRADGDAKTPRAHANRMC